MKRKILAVALILCMVLGTFGISFGVETEGWKEERIPNLIKRVGYAVAGVGDKIYMVGGEIYGNSGYYFTPELEVFDTKTKSLSKGKPYFARKKNFKAVAVGNTIYTIGGSGLNGGAFPTMESYNTTSNVWKSERSMMMPHGSGVAVAVGSEIYVIGGRDGVQDLNTVEIYDTKTGEWTAGAPMPTARYETTAAHVNGKIYVIGGRRTGMAAPTHLKTVEIYDIASDTWSTGIPYPSNNGGMAAVASGNKIYVVGGNPDFKSVYIYDTDTRLWEKGPSLKESRYDLGALNINGTIYAGSYLNNLNSIESLYVGEPDYTPGPEPDVSLDTESLTVLINSNEQVQLCITEYLEDNATVSWKSSDENVATVDSNGTVTAVSEGGCDITAYNSSGFKKCISIRVAGSQGGSTDFVYEKVNDTDSRITYSGSWTPYSNDPSFYNNDEHFSNQKDSYAEFTFEGTGINWIGATSNNLGICDVYIDGELVQAGLDQYSSSLEAQKVLFSKTGLSNGQHTIKIVITGEKNSSAIDVYGTVDAFEVIRTE